MNFSKEARILKETAFIHQLSGCTRYSREAGHERLTEARDLKPYHLDERILVQPEFRAEGSKYGFSIFDDYATWITHRNINGYSVAIQMLDPEQEATSWPTDTIGKKLIMVDVLFAHNMYLRMVPFIEEIQKSAYRLQLVRKLSSSRIYHDSFRLQDSKEEKRPSSLVMLGRYFNPLFVPKGQTMSTEGRLFSTPPIQLGEGKYFWNGTSFFKHNQADNPYAIEALTQVIEGQDNLIIQRDKQEIELSEDTWIPKGIEAEATCAESYRFEEEDTSTRISLQGYEGCKQIRMPKRFVSDKQHELKIQEDEIMAVVNDLELNIQHFIDLLLKDNNQSFDLTVL